MDSNAGKLTQMLGLHPLVGFGMFAVDSMLFAGTVATAGIGWAISIPVAAVFSIAAVFIQKSEFSDNWGMAIGKSLLVGLLTAIPTPIPSIFSLGGGVIGARKLRSESKTKLLVDKKENR